MNLPERLRWFGRMALMLFVLASAAFLSALTAMRFAIQGREVTMPNLAGKKYSDAQTILGSRGLGIAVADHVYSAQPVDTVVRQSPPADLRVKVGQVAHVVLSLGAQNVSIPKLDDHSLRAARLELLSGGLQLGEVSSVYLPDAPADFIIDQSPPAGKLGAASPKVDVLVSLGPRPAAYVMPELVGESLEEAEKRLRAAGLDSWRVSNVANPTLAPGTVSAQQPARGARVDESMEIELQVAQAALPAPAAEPGATPAQPAPPPAQPPAESKPPQPVRR
jgi:eukaryotic-like serine/threonine-protein kinase